MQRAEILIGAGRREREREFVPRIECLRPEELAARGDGMRDVVLVGPGDGRACLHGEALRREGELVDEHLGIGCLRRRGGESGCRCKNGCRKRDRDAGLACHCWSPGGIFPPQPCSGWSTMASRCCPRLKVTSVTPRSERNLSSATFIGPGEGAAPGAGCGKAVDMAV